MTDRYSREDLDNDLGLMVRAGLLEINMREDGVWVYSVSEACKHMTDQEREELIQAFIAQEEDEL